MDEKSFKDLAKHCDELAGFYAQRNRNHKAIDDMYFLRWEGPAKGGEQDVKVTISPHPRNAADGARQMLTAAEPQFSVPRERNRSANEKADLIEQAAQTMWYLAGRQRGKPIEYDAISMAVRRDEIVIGVMLTRDMLENARGSSQANIRRLERLADITPLYWEVYDPKYGYPEFDSTGLAGYFRKTKIKAGRVHDAWGAMAAAAGVEEDRWADIELCEWIDWSDRVVWIYGAAQPIFAGAHNLPALPIVCKLMNGSPMGETSDEQNQSLLYGILKSKLWQSANLYATIADTNALSLAANPTFVETLINPEEQPAVDYSTIGGVLRLRVGESHVPMAKNAVDPAITNQAVRTDALMEESSIFKVTLGQPMGGGNAPFSSVALLNQIGRQPLTSIQRMSSWAFAEAMQIGLQLLKDSGGRIKVAGRARLIDLGPDDLPDDLVIDCRVDVKLPTDDRQNALVGGQLVGAGLASRRWVRENILNIPQPGEMEKEQFFDRLLDQEIQIMLQQRLQLMAQQQQQQAAAAAGTQMQGADPAAEAAAMQPQGPGAMGPGGVPDENMLPDNMGAGLTAGPMTSPTRPQNMPPEMGLESESGLQGGL